MNDERSSGREANASAPHGRGRLGTLALTALGVVYGDIGTSPLYAVKECFGGRHGVAPTHDNVLGVLSLVFWALTLVIAVKYLTFVMRADNQGEGGILALFALVPRGARAGGRMRGVLLVVVFGAGLLYGDGVITPAISVLSAVEGLGVVADAARPLVLPATVAILVALFLLQRRGTERIGSIFGPIMLLWFVTIAALGLSAVLRRPSVLAAVDPRHAARFFAENGWHGFLVLGAVVLVITGGEALYADMGHFGPRPIRLGWFALVMPALALSYMGQGALLLESPEAAVNPFYLLVPAGLRYPMIALATLATVIASQALISGAFSLTQQAVQLGLFPRVTIVHTSPEAAGQIYVPEVNHALMAACVGLVLGFRASTNLAAAYGIAVTGTMLITTLVYFVVVRERWGWSAWRALPLLAAFLVVDLAFLAANLVKIGDGGLFPIVVGALVFVGMTTWRDGRAELRRIVLEASRPLEAFLADLDRLKPPRVAGTAVFMTSNPEGVPPVLLHHLKHNGALHARVVLMSIVYERVPVVWERDGLFVRDRGRGLYQIQAHFGFLETPSAPAILGRAARHGLPYRPEQTSYYLGRETLVLTGRSRMSRWRKVLFSFISRNARPATAYFGIPPDRVVELGMQVRL